MARGALANIAYSLTPQEEKLKEVTTRLFKSPIMGLLKDGNKITTLKAVGRSFYRYFNEHIYPAGGFGALSESSAYPAAQAELEGQLYAKLKFMAMTIGYTEVALKAMEIDPGKMVVGVQTNIRRAVKGVQDRLGRMITGRGDGFVARASALGSSASEVSSSTPVRLVPGDTVYADADSSGDARGLGGATSIDGIRVLNVDYSGQKFTLAGGDVHTWADDDIFYLSGAASNAAGAGIFMQGLEAHCDASGDSFQWDDDDDSTYDHVDTYLSGTRGTTFGLDVQEVDGASGYFDVEKLNEMVEKCTSFGANPNDLYVVCHPLQYRMICMNEDGYKPRTERVTLVGGDFTLPYLDGIQGGRVRVIPDYGIMNTEVIVLDSDKFFKLTAPGGWNKRTGSFWERRAGASASYPSYDAHFDIWLETGLFLPQTSCVGYDFAIA